MAGRVENFMSAANDPARSASTLDSSVGNKERSRARGPERSRPGTKIEARTKGGSRQTRFVVPKTVFGFPTKEGDPYS